MAEESGKVDQKTWENDPTQSEIVKGYAFYSKIKL